MSTSHPGKQGGPAHGRVVLLGAGKDGSEEDQGALECAGGSGGLTVCVSSACIYGGGEVCVECGVGVHGYGCGECISGLCVCVVLLLHQQAISKLSGLSHKHFVIAHGFMDQSRLLVLERWLSG